MRFRRRYEVVVEGVSGQAAAQRSVVSEHRSASEARERARAERARLEVIHGASAQAWRVLVEVDGRVVHEERPQAEGEDLLAAAAEPEAELPPEPEPAPEPEQAPAEEPAAEPPEAAEPAAAPANGAPAPEPPPSGPVPDWVIRRFEESIARRGEREDRGPQPKEAGGPPASE